MTHPTSEIISRMKYLDLTLPTPAENLACDEALLDACENEFEEGVLRFWESPEHFVVVGYANSAVKEVNLPACDAENIPVLRRISGGGTVLQGPGCLNYSVVLRIPESGPLTTITGANKLILEKQRAVVEALAGKTVRVEGQTDLAIGDLKFSGNAQRRKHRAFLYHGTLLLEFDLAMIEKYLRMPSRQPDYRGNRSHGEFLMNLGLSREVVKRAIQKTWNAKEPFANIPMEKIAELAAQKYSTAQWNFRS